MTVTTGDWAAGSRQPHMLVLPVGSVSGLVERAWLSLATSVGPGEAEVRFLASPGEELESHQVALVPGHRVFWELPNGSDQIELLITSEGPVGWSLELAPYDDDE